MKKILIPVTNHATLGTTDQANGTFSPEITHAIHVFTQHGFDYDIASITGGQVPVYGTDIEDDEVNQQVLASEAEYAIPTLLGDVDTEHDLAHNAPDEDLLDIPAFLRRQAN